MRSHCPDIPAIRLLWTIMTPLGLPVEPLVYMITARSDGSGLTIGLITAKQTLLLCGIVCMKFFIYEFNTHTQKMHNQIKIRTILGQSTQLLYSLHAVDG